MRIVHFTQMAPNNSGMYESTKDQIKYERQLGLDSHIIDPFIPYKNPVKDDWLETTFWEDANEFDVWVVHAGLPLPLKNYIKNEKHKSKHALVSVLHGPVEHMLFKEYSDALRGKWNELSFTEIHINMIWHYDRCVVINKHEYDISKLYDENNHLVYIPNSIDLERIDYNATPWPYVYRPAIVSADYPRFEKNPAHILWSMPKIKEKIPDARLNLLGLPVENFEFWRNLLLRSKNWHLLRKCVESIHVKGGIILPYLNGADVVFNCNFSGIVSRVHMEAMAMGVPIVSCNGDYTEYHAKIFDIDSIAETVTRCIEDLSPELKEKTKAYAFEHYDRSKYVPQYVELYKTILKEKNIV